MLIDNFKLTGARFRRRGDVLSGFGNHVVTLVCIISGRSTHRLVLLPRIYRRSGCRKADLVSAILFFLNHNNYGFCHYYRGQ